MQIKKLLSLIFIFLPINTFAAPEEKQPEIPPAVIEKLNQLQKGELNQLEKIKLADELHRAGAKPEALALYEENLPIDHIKRDLPPEAYLNYGTALLEKGDEQKGLIVYDTLAQSMDSKDPKTQKIKDIIEKNVVNFFQVQEQKKKEQEKQNKENKDNKDQKDNQQGEGSKQNQKNQQGKENKDQQDQKNQGQQPQDKKNKQGDKGQEKDKKQDKGDQNSEEKSQDENNKDKNNDGKDGEQKKNPPSKMSPKLKQLMSDDRQMQLRVIEQGTRDMNRRQNRENKDW